MRDINVRFRLVLPEVDSQDVQVLTYIQVYTKIYRRNTVPVLVILTRVLHETCSYTEGRSLGGGGGQMLHLPKAAQSKVQQIGHKNGYFK
jgi:hypothetical protein